MVRARARPGRRSLGMTVGCSDGEIDRRTGSCSCAHSRRAAGAVGAGRHHGVTAANSFAADGGVPSLRMLHPGRLTSSRGNHHANPPLIPLPPTFPPFPVSKLVGRSTIGLYAPGAAAKLAGFRLRIPPAASVSFRSTPVRPSRRTRSTTLDADHPPLAGRFARTPPRASRGRVRRSVPGRRAARRAGRRLAGPAAGPRAGAGARRRGGGPGRAPPGRRQRRRGQRPRRRAAHRAAEQHLQPHVRERPRAGRGADLQPAQHLQRQPHAQRPAVPGRPRRAGHARRPQPARGRHGGDGGRGAGREPADAGRLPGGAAGGPAGRHPGEQPGAGRGARAAGGAVRSRAAAAARYDVLRARVERSQPGARAHPGPRQPRPGAAGAAPADQPAPGAARCA